MFIKNLLFLLFIIFISFCIYFSKNIKLDASSDSLIMQNNETFQYFKYYNKIFPSKNFLVLAIKSKKEIDRKYVENINKINNQLNELKNVESTFSIVDAPILLLNNKKISNLATDEIENINNTKNKLNLVLNEFAKSPIFGSQIINFNKDTSSIIIYINKNNEFEKIRNLHRNNTDNINFKEEYLIEKKKNNFEKEMMINDIRNILKNQNNDYEYYLGGIDMIANDTISFIENDIIIFS